MVNIITAAAACSSRDQEEHSLHLSNFSDSSDVSIDILNATDSKDQLLLFQSAVSGSSQVTAERNLDDSDHSDITIMSIESAVINEEVNMMSISMRDLTFDPVDQCDEIDLSITSRNSLYLDATDLCSDSSAVDSLRSSRACEMETGRSTVGPRKRIAMKDVDFDPTPCSGDAQLDHHSMDDLTSLCSFNTAQTSQAQVAADAPNICSNPLLKSDEQLSYYSALEKLVQCMEQTQQTRRQVALQRSLLTPNQRAALEEGRRRQLLAIQTEALIPVQTTSPRELSPTRSSIMNAFFAGSRNTLTNGLEQSRRQLRNYMGQVQNQTL